MQSEVVAFQGRLQPLSGSINQLNRVLANPNFATPLLQSTQSTVNGLLGDAEQVRTRLETLYRDLEGQIQSLNQRLTQIHWAMEQLEDARFGLERGEELVMAVPARQDEESENDAEGILYLTDKRLLFEQKEKEATKKVLFITLASELVHKLIFDGAPRSAGECEG